MKLIPILAAAASIFTATSAFSAGVTIDFEGTSGYGYSIDNFYNGGTDTGGASGVNYGVNFSLPALALANDGLADTPSGNYYSGAPTNGGVMFVGPSGVNINSEATYVPAVMNVASGFLGAISFYYAAKTNPALAAGTTVTVYDGVNGSGNVVGTGTFGANSDGNPEWDNWSLATLTLSGMGKSISFGDNGGYIAYDNVTVNAVPLPAALLLFPFGAAALGVAGRRRRQQA